jgi:hypothetical protein
MMTIYGKADLGSAKQLMEITNQALEALRGAAEHLEASGQSAMTERATLETLRDALDRLEQVHSQHRQLRDL